MPVLIRCTLECGHCKRHVGAVMPLKHAYSDGNYDIVRGKPLLEEEWRWAEDRLEVYCSPECEKLASSSIKPGPPHTCGDPNDTCPECSPSGEPLDELETDPETGVRIHPRSACDGRASCVFHNPSDHHMKKWPKILRASGLVERQCEHGIGHPDPDSVAYFKLLNGDHRRMWLGVHGCDGCCREKK
jgi:hypothetical protein